MQPHHGQGGGLAEGGRRGGGPPVMTLWSWRGRLPGRGRLGVAHGAGRCSGGIWGWGGGVMGECGCGGMGM